MMLPLSIKTLLAAGAIVSMLLTTGIAASANNHTISTHSSHAGEQPIRFVKGQISSTISGKLSPKQHERWYQLSATSGQYAVINITALPGTSETANVGVLHMPDGSQDGTKGGIIYQGCLPTSGKYRLRIARNLMLTEGKTAGYIAEIIILPKYASQALCG
jgi:hypothetical protein